MELKRIIKKEGILICIVLTLIYSTELTKLEFLMYQNFHALLFFLTASLLVLASYLTRKSVYKALSPIAKLLKIKLRMLYAFNKQVATRYLTLAWKKSKFFMGLSAQRLNIVYKDTALFSKTTLKKLTNGTKDILDIKGVIPKKESVTESLAIAHMGVRKKKSIYKIIGTILANTFIISFLIKGLKIESNSITIPGYLEIQFLAYKSLILVGHKIFIATQMILEYSTLQNVSLAILTTSIAYALSTKRFRETAKNLLLEAHEIVTIQTKKISKGISKKILVVNKKVLGVFSFR